MTQATSPLLNLRLSPMRVMEAVPRGAETYIPSRQLLLHPGEASEMLVRLENLSEQPLQLTLWIESDCPSDWYRLGMEGNDILPGQRMDAVIRFQPPEDFFENQQALQAGQQLVLDYHCRVFIDYIAQETGQRHMEYANFNLYLRPRSLYPSFLPVLYREVDLISRFLKIFEQAFEPASQAMDAMWAYLDPLSASEALLPFLAHWVAWPIDSRWDLAQQRRLVRHALEIYRWRGTRRGLRFYLHLYTDLPLDEHLSDETEKHIRIQEAYHQGFILNNARLGEDAALGGGRPYHFTVHLRPERAEQVDEALVRLILDREKPAFCTYELYIEEPLEEG